MTSLCFGKISNDIFGFLLEDAAAVPIIDERRYCVSCVVTAATAGDFDGKMMALC